MCCCEFVLVKNKDFSVQGHILNRTGILSLMLNQNTFEISSKEMDSNIRSQNASRILIMSKNALTQCFCRKIVIQNEKFAFRCFLKNANIFRVYVLCLEERRVLILQQKEIIHNQYFISLLQLPKGKEADCNHKRVSIC